MQKKSNIKLVLFDLDGTLIDTAPDFITSLNNVLSKYNKKNLTSNEIKTHQKFYEDLIQLNVSILSQEEYKDAVFFLYNKHFPKKEEGVKNATK